MRRKEPSHLFLSHSLDILLLSLKEQVFKRGSTPFERRLIVVPSLSLKRFVSSAFAFDETIQVAAGFEVVNLTQAYGKLTQTPLPSQLELTLFLQYLVAQSDDEELRAYCQGQGERMTPFCAALAVAFLRYAIYGCQPLAGWQKRLWDHCTKRWSLPRQAKPVAYPGQLHLFGFSFLPKVYQQFFTRSGASLYLFSPCAFFWGDYYSEKERARLEKSVPLDQLDLFRESFAEQNPLLASCGKVGRKMARQIEETPLQTVEDYPPIEGERCLQAMQADLVQGLSGHYSSDESLSFFSAPTKLRELQVLKEKLLHLFHTEGVMPSDVQVFAPDINLYAPYLEAVFGGEEHPIAYRVSDLERKRFDPASKHWTLLLQLVESRFSKEALFHLFRSPLFLQKFRLEPEEVDDFERWALKANIVWGFSEKHRALVYEQEALRAAEGSWTHGLDRLVLGLGEWEGDKMPLCLIDPTEMELFSRFYELLHSLYDDLSPLIDGTRWTLSTWFRYCATLLSTYFSIDVEEDLYIELQTLASACDDLDQAEVSFATLEGVLDLLVAKKNVSIQPPHLQALSFASLGEGVVLPSQVIACIGMDEEAFPQSETPLSFASQEIDDRPPAPDIDRFLFLQLFLFAKHTLIFSFVEKEKRGASLVIQELLPLIEGARVHSHPLHAFEEPGYSLSCYRIATAPKGTKRPLIPSFYEAQEPKQPLDAPLLLDVQKWLLFARHPLRFYLEEQLGVRFPWKEEAYPEFLLSFPLRTSLAKQALLEPLETVFEKATKRGEFPLHLCAPLAKAQVAEERTMWREALDTFGVRPEEIESLHLSVPIAVGGCLLKGRLDQVTPRGILVRSVDSFKDQVALAPLAALAHHLNLGPLLALKEKKVVEWTPSLEEQLAYFRLAQANPSPLTPTLVEPICKGSKEELVKALEALKEGGDRTWEWLLLRDPVPSADALLTSWHAPSARWWGGICESI